MIIIQLSPNFKLDILVLYDDPGSSVRCLMFLLFTRS